MQSVARNGWNSDRYDWNDQIADFFLIHTDRGGKYVHTNSSLLYY